MRVITCGNKKWAHLSLQLNMSAVNYKDIQCIEMFIPNSNKLCILNVYNDLKSLAAFCYLKDKASDMPEIHVIAGDFNLCYHSWNKQEPVNGSIYSIVMTDLISLLTTKFNMTMLNDSERPHIWSSNRMDQYDSTLNLAWIDNGYNIIDHFAIH